MLFRSGGGQKWVWGEIGGRALGTRAEQIEKEREGESRHGEGGGGKWGIVCGKCHMWGVSHVESVTWSETCGKCDMREV